MKTFPGAGAIVVNDTHEILLIKVKRFGIERWELPSALQKDDESLLRTVSRCIEEETNFQYAAQVIRPVCFCLHTSERLIRRFYGLFFECEVEKVEANQRMISTIPDHILPNDAREEILEFGFHNWKDTPKQEFHPLHRLILEKWEELESKAVFGVQGDGDEDIKFHQHGLAGTANLSFIERHPFRLDFAQF